jgi:hypothetical protein
MLTVRETQWIQMLPSILTSESVSHGEMWKATWYCGAFVHEYAQESGYRIEV